MNLYNEFKNIENRLSGKEPTIHGGTYYFAVDRLDNPEEDIKKICNDWHIEQVLTERLSELISASQRYYKVC